jgi:YesN/AraC family two-component response regulator
MAYNIKVMVVDDDTHVRNYMTILVRNIVSRTVLQAENGDAAVEMFNDHRPDLVLLDVNMPKMNGLQALEKIREIEPNAVVVMITSLATRKIVEDAADFGACHFIRKDTPKDEITEIVKEIIEERLISKKTSES